MSQPIDQPYLHVKMCRECGADSQPHATICWLCGASLANAPSLVIAERVPGRRQAVSEAVFAGLSILAIGVTFLVIVGLGLNRDQFGLSIGMAVLTVPALVAVAVQTLVRYRQGDEFSWQRMFVTYIMSVGIAAMIIVALGLAIVVALIVMCFAIVLRG